MKKCILIFVPAILIVVACYFLFEPVFLYTSGRDSFPDVSNVQPKNNHMASNHIELNSLFVKAYNDLQTPGLSVAVGVDGDMYWDNQIGYANVEKGVLVDSETQFRVGSTSKAITSIGLGTLLQSGSIALDQPLKTYISYASKNTASLTIKQLASHTSGVRNYSACFCFPIWEVLNNDEYSSVRETVSIFDKDDLLFTPGTSFSYSSFNYNLLSAAMEGSSKQDFLSLMNTSVFQPIGMKNTIGETEMSLANNSKTLATFYDVENENLKPVYPVNNSNKWAGGGFISTPTDLVMMGNSVLSNEILDPHTLKALWTPTSLENGEINEQSYAIGWRNSLSENVIEGEKVRIVHHGGVAQGSTSFLVLYPEHKIVVSILMNRSGFSPFISNLAHAIAREIISKKEKSDTARVASDFTYEK